MTFLQAIILGIVQGATEFLPISSSGHLVLTPYIFGWQIPEEQVFVFDTWVQVGSLLAVFVYFWQDIYAIARITLTSLGKPERYALPEVRLGFHIILATIPAVIGGIFLRASVERAFSSPTITAVFLLVTASLLVIAEQFGKRSNSLEDMRAIDALVIGVFQVLALFPGVSRSGATITGGMLRNLKRREAARFSFLMSLPVMIGAAVYTGPELLSVFASGGFFGPMLAGFAASAVVGYLAIRWLIGYLANHTFYLFSAYLVILAVLVLTLV